VFELFGNFRELYRMIRGERYAHLYERVVAPWIESNSGSRQWLHDFSHRSGNPIPPSEHADLWGLYALSRVNDVLITPFQGNLFDGDASRSKDKLEILLPDHLLFAESLGLKKVERPLFSAFHHEIVVVEESADEDQPVRLESTLWPCLMLGDMMFSRAGARVSGGRQFISKQVAESSTLYWTFERNNRPVNDLSHGWGSNSQWRTSFRRDYQIGGELYYNVDGKHDLRKPFARSEDQDGLSQEERIELLVNRCFIVTERPHTDLWPFDDTLRTA
jgi:hypothetical protein